MKIQKLIDDPLSNLGTDELQKTLLDRVVKIRKLQKEMNEDAEVQKAQDALEIAKLPFKKVRARWSSEIEAIELELKSRNVKYNIKWDDIHGEKEI